MSTDMFDRIGPLRTAPQKSRAGRILSTLVGNAKKAWELFTDALELEAEIVAAMTDELNGEFSLHKGTRSEAAWQDIAKGVRRLHAFDLCRMFTSKRPQARAAAERVLSILAAKIGLTVTPLHSEGTRVLRAGMDLLHGTTGALSRLEAMLKDGHFSNEERETALRDVRTIKVLVGSYEKSLHIAPEMQQVAL
jgi:hypothetical protein